MCLICGAAQDVFVDPTRDESLIFELLDLKGEVEDAGSALWFLRDIANEQDAGDNMVAIVNSPLTCLLFNKWSAIRS